MKRTDITAIFPDATDEQISKIMNLNGSDINAAKGSVDDLKTQLAALNAELEKSKKTTDGAASADELQKAQDRAAALENELNGLKLSNQLRDMRAAVAKEKGVPVELLNGDSEDACKAQADGILAFAKPNGYPNLHDGGEVSSVSAASTRDKFAAWAKDNIGFKS